MCSGNNLHVEMDMYIIERIADVHNPHKVSLYIKALVLLIYRVPVY